MENTKKAHIAGLRAIKQEVEPGIYAWCSCGLSSSQPFCDGSHKGTEFSPIEYKAAADGTVYFCGCKQSKNGTLCDGSHKSL
jgi:CDGSH-type Zn-finger protein